MESIAYGLFLLVLSAAIVTVLSRRWLLEALIEALHNFRGGPPTAMHPSPVNDGVLLRHRFRTLARRSRWRGPIV